MRLMTANPSTSSTCFQLSSLLSFLSLLVLIFTTTVCGSTTSAVVGDATGSTPYKQQRYLQADQTPGCLCPATDCIDDGEGAIGGDGPDQQVLGVCVVSQFNAEVNVTTSDPICDVVDNDEMFQTDFGTLSEPFFFQTPDGQSTGPWASSGGVFTQIGLGSCQDVYDAQSSCFDGTVPNPNVTSSSASIVEPNGCGQVTFTAVDGTQFKRSTQCRGYSSVGEGVTVYGMDVYLTQLSDGTDIDLCDADGLGLTPLLTDADWVEIQPGRTYMCGEFPYQGDTYYMFLVNLGNEPCSEGMDAPTAAPSGAISITTIISFVGLFAASSTMMAIF